MDFMTTYQQKDWWVVQSKPNAEFTAMENLKRQGFVTYCPLFKKEYIRGKKIRIKSVFLFSRYLFVEASILAEKNIHLIRSTIGVFQHLKIGERPVILTSSVIESIRKMERKYLGHIEDQYNPGETVKINEGIYQGLDAVFHMSDGLERAVVLINLINQETELNLPKHHLSKQ